MENKKIVSYILFVIVISVIFRAFWYHHMYYIRAFQIQFLFVALLQIVASVCILKIFQSDKQTSMSLCFLAIPIIFILANIYGTLTSLDITAPYNITLIIFEITKCGIIHFLIGVIFAFLPALIHKKAMLKQ